MFEAVRKVKLSLHMTTLQLLQDNMMHSTMRYSSTKH